MNAEISLLQGLVPDLIKEIRQRYSILEQISAGTNVGRRTLAAKLGLSERTIRSESDYLKKLELISITNSGMQLTDKGKRLFLEMRPLLKSMIQSSNLERQLARGLNIERTMIVPGDVSVTVSGYEMLAEKLSSALDLLLPLDQQIVTVLGGFTLAQVADKLSPRLGRNRRLNFVPGRGALGEDVTTQSNTIVQKMAKATASNYQTLYLPEKVSPEAYHSLLRDSAITSVLESISKSDAVIHGVGAADEMAQRRGFSSLALSELRSKGAVTECFGCFFNSRGEIVESISRVGLQFEDLKKIPHIFAVACGKNKAAAIKAYMQRAPQQTWLITDEVCANQILKGK